ncbi:hypothetical protein DFH05DRAFT_1145357 [Lentinula detonsa]|uniref:Uncharacterized protein n=1 Tax=Lentinula detonsa TaxID=2804962 RepID=A0A9W8NZI4_9AGAR|nr:hypothetical protein DFH05DRAFT_1145357 [Lentinula detonsa]
MFGLRAEECQKAVCVLNLYKRTRDSRACKRTLGFVDTWNLLSLTFLQGSIEVSQELRYDLHIPIIFFTFRFVFRSGFDQLVGKSEGFHSVNLNHLNCAFSLQVNAFRSVYTDRITITLLWNFRRQFRSSSRTLLKLTVPLVFQGCSVFFFLRAFQRNFQRRGHRNVYVCFGATQGTRLDS